MPPFWADDGARVALAQASMNPNEEPGGDNFEQTINELYKSNGIVFACVVARARVFSQIRFKFQEFVGGVAGNLVGHPSLSLLETPWWNGSTGELLTLAEIDASAAGNSFWTVVDDKGRIGRRAKLDNNPFLARMRPDWTKLLIDAPSGNPYNVDARVVGLQFSPPGMKNDPLLLTRGEFAHYSPLPDPSFRFRGMSWLTPIVRDIAADSAYTDHKLAFLRNGATPNMVVKLTDELDDDEFKAFVERFRETYEGAPSAYKTLFLSSGADVEAMSLNFQQLDLKKSQGGIETRIASAAGVHPTIVGLSEGLEGSSLNEGNFHAARRLFVDMTIRDLWAKFTASMQPLVPPPKPKTQRLWYDDNIPFLHDDDADEAETFLVKVQALRGLTDSGWDQDKAVDAVSRLDITAVKGSHTGLFSVQLQEPGSGSNGQQQDQQPAMDNRPAPNGNGRVPANAR